MIYLALEVQSLAVLLKIGFQFNLVSERFVANHNVPV